MGSMYLYILLSVSPVWFVCTCDLVFWYCYNLLRVLLGLFLCTCDQMCLYYCSLLTYLLDLSECLFGNKLNWLLAQF